MLGYQPTTTGSKANEQPLCKKAQARGMAATRLPCVKGRAQVEHVGGDQRTIHVEVVVCMSVTMILLNGGCVWRGGLLRVDQAQ